MPTILQTWFFLATRPASSPSRRGRLSVGIASVTGASIGAVGAARTATTGNKTEIMVDKRIVRMFNDVVVFYVFGK